MKNILKLGSFDKVLANYTADLIFTSPPYNIGSKSPAKTGTRSAKKGTYDSKSYRGICEYSDNMPEEEYQESQLNFILWCEKHLNRNGYIVYNHKPRHRDGKLIHPMSWISPACENSGLVLVEEVVWNRGSTHNHCTSFLWQHTERLYVLRRGSDKNTFHNSKILTQRSDVWNISKEVKSEHNAPFPVNLAKEVISSWSKEGQIVMDPYSGSGTTMIAAKELGRGFVGAEILENYFNLARGRLEENDYSSRSKSFKEKGRLGSVKVFNEERRGCR